MKIIFRGGQVGLMLLVIVAAVVALIMSVASRSLSDTVLSRQEKESSAAFSVAETGIETAFNELRLGSATPDETATFTVTSPTGSTITGKYGVFPTSTFALYMKEGETAHLNLAGYTGATVDIYWTKKGDLSEDIPAPCVEGSGTSPAAIEINAILELSDRNVLSYINSSSCSGGPAGFLNSLDGGATYRSRLTYTIPTTPTYPTKATALRIKPLYAGATIQVTGTNLPTQLYKVQASGAGGDAQKEIEVKRGLDAPASIFDYAIFSGGTIVKP